MTKYQLKWIGHVQRSSLETLMRRVDYMVFSRVRRGRGKPKRGLEEIVKTLKESHDE